MKPASNRLLYLDWVRGLAAATMLQGHVFHSFLRTNLRSGGPYAFSQFCGGMPPAIFLFLTGVTFAFLMESQERKGAPLASRWIASLKRAGYLFLVAFGFRLQLWVFALYFSPGSSPWTDLLRVDILNCMGFALLVLSLAAFLNSRNRIRLCLVAGIVIAGVAPFVTQLDFAGVSPYVKNYIVPSNQFFGFFPWAAFVAFGMSFGSLLRSLKPEQFTHVMQWSALGGILLALGANAVPLRFYPKVDFWLDSPALIMIKVGVILLMISFAYIWLLQPAAQSWSWIRTLGTNSLLVYWVHIELVYGHWLGFWKENLNVVQTGLLAAAIIVLMLGLCLLHNNYQTIRASIASFRWFGSAEPAPEPVSGD
jgi:uncharacterized membrane protein